MTTDPHTPDDAQPEYELEMPFVSVASNGGPHDDASYVAGWEMGALDARLTHEHPVIVEMPIHAANVAQADLLAMRHGYGYRIDEYDDEWSTLTLRRKQPGVDACVDDAAGRLFDAIREFLAVPEETRRGLVEAFPDLFDQLHTALSGGPLRGGASGTPDAQPVDGVLAEVLAERVRQDERWGQQNHPPLFPGDLVDATYHHRQAEMWKALNDQRVGVATGQNIPSDRNSAWDGVLLEEVHEAYAETDPQAQRAELVQVAAVAVAAIEHIDRVSAESPGRQQ